MKSLIWIAITIGGIVGGWLGSLIDHGSGFGTWSIILGVLGSLAGIWAVIRFGE